VGIAADEIVRELSELHGRLRDVIALSADLDRKPADDANSIAVLVTHALGAEMGWLHLAAGRPRARDRASEFTVSRTTAADLTRAVDEAERLVPDLVRAAFDAGLDARRERPGAQAISVGYCVAHAVAHTAEHVGQAELTRQVLGVR